MADTANAAALRDALERVLAAYKSGAIHTCAECYRDEWDDELGDLKVAVEIALAEPPRNCDRFNSGDPTTDAANAYDEWQRYCDDPLIPPSCKLESAFKQWLFATMKENGGNKQ